MSGPNSGEFGFIPPFPETSRAAMHPWAALVRWFLRGPELSGNARRTFRWHLAYALLDGAAGGILFTAPFVAVKAFGAANWHLPLRELYAGIGMIATLYLGSRMATRPKMPFVFFPGLLAGLCSLLMAAVTGQAFWFLTLWGLGAMCEIITRPAVTAVLRVNYPVDQRGHATGRIREWSSLAFATASVLSALMLHWSAGQVPAAGSVAPAVPVGAGRAWLAGHMPPLLMLLGGVLSLVSFLCFRQIRVDEDLRPESREERPKRGLASGFREAFAVMRVRDGRFRRCLLGCFAEGFFHMLYAPLIWAFLIRDLGFGYLAAVVLAHTLPALVASAATGMVGRLLDRTNPWAAWGWIRCVWGLDAILLALTPACALLFSPARVILPVGGRTLRGGVQGGWWIMWWQVGVTYFAPPGADTSRYMAVMVFLNGTVRVLASAAGMVLTALSVSPGVLLAVGGLGVILSGLYSLGQARWDRQHRGPETISEFEHRFDEADLTPQDA